MQTSSVQADKIDEGLRGTKLYGDDFSLEEIARWFEAEREGFADIWAKDRSRYQYEFHALNHAHHFRYLPKQRFSHVLSIGGAYGDELLPIVPSISRITILEPSDVFVSKEIGGVPVNYVKPQPAGEMPFSEGEFDLVTCFGCLHHIPNVTRVVGEVFRCLAPGGMVLVREPIVSMGDWRAPRNGLTKMERGIPIEIFRRIIHTSGFEVMKETLCVFPVIPRLHFLFGAYVYNSPTAVFLDRLLSQWFAWNNTYHATRIVEKLRPSAVGYVLRKPS